MRQLSILPTLVGRLQCSDGSLLWHVGYLLLSSTDPGLPHHSSALSLSNQLNQSIAHHAANATFSTSHLEAFIYMIHATAASPYGVMPSDAVPCAWHLQGLSSMAVSDYASSQLASDLRTTSHSLASSSALPTVSLPRFASSRPPQRQIVELRHGSRPGYRHNVASAARPLRLIVRTE